MHSLLPFSQRGASATSEHVAGLIYGYNHCDYRRLFVSKDVAKAELILVSIYQRCSNTFDCFNWYAHI